MNTSSRIAIFAIAIAASGMVASSAFAQSASASASSTTQWDKNHPRRAEVNGRLANQNKRITNEEKSGQITKSEAQGLRANDKTIHGEEKAMATQDGGHITKTDKKALNQQLDKNSGAIGK